MVETGKDEKGHYWIPVNQKELTNRDFDTCHTCNKHLSVGDKIYSTDIDGQVKPVCETCRRSNKVAGKL